MRILQRSQFLLSRAEKTERMWKTRHKSLGFCIAKPAPAHRLAPNVEKRFNYSLRSRNLGQMRSQSPFVTFHPELFQVKSKCQKEQLRANILPSPCEETAEAKVVFEQPEGAFHLDRPALTQIAPVLGRDVFKRSFPQFLKRLVYPQLLGLISILRLAAFIPDRAAGTAFAAKL